MELFCDKCQGKSALSTDQIEHVEKSREKGMKFIMVRCSLCERSVAINPMTMEFENAPIKKTGDGLRCPCKTCYGHISYVEDGTCFWGCGECGKTWNTIEALFGDIDKSIKKYPYRGKVYKKHKNKCYFTPVAAEKEPRNYEELVHKEWEET
jgi:hypothetical protein